MAEAGADGGDEGRKTGASRVVVGGEGLKTGGGVGEEGVEEDATGSIFGGKGGGREGALL